MMGFSIVNVVLVTSGIKLVLVNFVLHIVSREESNSWRFTRKSWGCKGV